MGRVEPYYQDDFVTLYHGDATTTLRALPDQSVNCVVTSPPYFGLRDYGATGQLGQEATPAEFVESLVRVFQEVHRVLADDGTLWLNLGDSYANSNTTSFAETGKHVGRPMGARARGDRPAKSLLGIPWRVAFALQDAGWILRNEVIWHKNNGMPESVADRLANKHEHLFLFTKQQRYHFDLDAIRVEPAHDQGQVPRGSHESWNMGVQYDNSPRHTGYRGSHPNGKNPGDVWTLNSQPFPGAHFATFPPALPRRCIQAGCKQGGVVLDPFSGSGTTGEQALLLGRKYVGIDVNREYLDLSLQTRLAQEVLPLWEGGAS